MHLLGSWREKSAYRPLAKLLRLPPDAVEAFLGDATTESSHRVMAAVFDGDPQPLFDLVLDAGVEEFVRARMCEAVAMVTLRGDLPRAEAARFLQACPDLIKPERNNFVWFGWQSAVAMLGLADLEPRVRKAFERGSVDPSWLGFADFERDLEYAIAHEGALPYAQDDEYTLFGDPVEELSGGYDFTPENESGQRQRRREPVVQSANHPVVALFPKVGRNELCPCGSGRKFKKCCLNVSLDRVVA